MIGRLFLNVLIIDYYLNEIMLNGVTIILMTINVNLMTIRIYQEGCINGDYKLAIPKIKHSDINRKILCGDVDMYQELCNSKVFKRRWPELQTWIIKIVY